MERNSEQRRNAPVIACAPNLILRPVRMADADALYGAIRRNWDVLREWLPWLAPTYSMEDMLRFLEERERDNTDCTALAMLICEGDEIRGGIALHRIDARNRSTSIGYWLDAEHHGKGIMTNACRAIVDVAFREYGLHRVEIRCATGNTRSSAIPLRLGFREEGTLSEAEWLYDHWVDLRVFSMLEQDWK